MRLRRIGLAFAFVAGWSALADATVRVTFLDPGRYRDSDRAGGVLTPNETLGRVAAYLRHLGDRLPPGLDADIQVLDLNLAGATFRFDPAAQTTRFLSRGTWPSVRLRYVLRDRGRVVLQAEELVADREYLSRPNTYFAEDPLRFEKALLYDWFDARLVRRRAPPPST